MSRWSRSRSGSAEGSLPDLLRAGDSDALTGFYDARAGYVRAYCAAVCQPEDVDDATLAAFIDFLARADGAGADDDLDLLLVKATRGSAAGRMRIDTPEATCRAMPDVLAARANGEHRHDEHTFEAHLDECAVCRDTARRLLGAEQALKGDPGADPAEHVRESWLAIAAGRSDDAA